MAETADAQDLNARYFRGLRERGLYLIAEDYAVSRLNDKHLLPDERARIAVEHARTLTEHGAYSSDDQRLELWTEAGRVLSVLLKNNPENPRRIEVEGELSLLPCRFAEHRDWALQVNSSDTRAIHDVQHFAAEGLKNCLRFLATLKSVDRSPSRSELSDGALSANDLRKLEQEVEYFRAQMLLYLAEHTSAGPERAGKTLDAAQQLESLIKSKPESAWTVRARLTQAKLARKDQNYSLAKSILIALQSDAEEFGLGDAVVAEKVRNEFDQQQIDDGLELITRRSKQGSRISDELRAVAVEGLLAAWKVAAKQNKQELQEELLKEAEGHHAIVQGKWHQYTFSLLRRVQEEVDLGGELARVVREAQASYYSQDFTQAVQKYNQAATVAFQKGKHDLAVEYAFTSGSIEVQVGHWEQAARIFEDIASRFPESSKASDAGLMRCYALGQIYLATPNMESRVAYEEALRQQQQRFAGSTSAAEASWMLAVHQEQRLQWTDALELYRMIPPDHPRFDQASLRIVILYDKILSRLRELDGPIEEWEDALLQEIVRIEGHFPPGSDVLRSLVQCQTSLQVAQLLLQHRERWYAVADHWLRRIQQTVDYHRREAMIQGESLDSVWVNIERAAAQMRIVSLSGQEKLGEARAIMLELEKTDPLTMLGILIGLTDMTSRIDPQNQVEMGHLQLEAIQRLMASRDQLTEQQSRMLDLSHAEAFVAIGNLPEAADLYEKLIEKSPRDEALIRKLISVLTRRGKANDLVRAREWWTRVERLHQSGTPPWVEVRLNIAILDSRLGKQAEARKLLGVTKTLYPALGNEALKAQVEEFMAELSQE